MAKEKPIAPAAKREKAPAERSNAADIEAFLSDAKAMAAAASGEAGRLIFALDATMSRQPTWDRACALQGEMFAEAARIGGLSVQLVYYRGLGECRASRWVADARALGDLMTRIDCRGGHTQIRKVLAHARKEAKKNKPRALVFVGDAMEENADDLAEQAGELGLLGVPVFVFEEGHDPVAEPVFREIARLSGGAWCRFDSGSAEELRALLKAVAAYAAGGRQALADHSKAHGGKARLLLQQMR
ncbi:MAG: VWA domain-containing protein [Hyphomicrobiales bacterium]|nr:VWA domain-containing protein [Hyphomicrobiales bacterium]